jgi:allantoinase
MGPGLHETENTLDIRAEEGREYVCDCVNDDQPYPMQVRQGRLSSMPYTVELNDIRLFVVQHHPSPEMLNRCRTASRSSTR